MGKIGWVFGEVTRMTQIKNCFPRKDKVQKFFAGDMRYSITYCKCGRIFGSLLGHKTRDMAP